MSAIVANKRKKVNKSESDFYSIKILNIDLPLKMTNLLFVHSQNQ
ncbi:hypothetical protein C427_3552 [Paraglaciecola psychrophila 170]|uniref:Uncharacterized protein n=1 Tax=Paraglaciecola psychrophila 170 TaxID=1129794 RepID=K7AQ53_9ALTE|nr:hypothetical protein C427_3552 [Paraglaciecola psychrophila 170]GAC37430.1 hypothetical protein GPSY_1801 [Paraglaciecola psychrophila 170]